MSELKPSWLMMIALVKHLQDHPGDKRDPALIVREFSEEWRADGRPAAEA